MHALVLLIVKQVKYVTLTLLFKCNHHAKNKQVNFVIKKVWKNTITCDAPPSSLIDSTASPTVKIMKGEGVEAHSLAHNTLGVEGHVGVPGWGLRRLTSNSITHTTLHRPKQQVG